MDAQLVAQRLSDAFSNDDLWTNPSVVDSVEDLADEHDALKAENAKLRDLIFDMLVDEERGSTEESTYYEHVRLAKELGIGWSR